ncbi:MAG TPA: hypothetical protein VMX76_03645 [Nevskiaceae bacterium]|nr:hypothetical protein [Nevskiaceae bacterium]
MKTYLVIPTIRDLSFLKAWKGEFAKCHLIVVEDHPKRQIKIPSKNFLSIKHFCWLDIDGDLGKNAWIISRKNAGIRCYGFWKAYQEGAEAVITLDDDCYPAGRGFVKGHLENLRLKAPQSWFSTYPHAQYLYTRGIPYQVRDKYPVVLSHGLWSGSIDLDAQTELKTGKLALEPFNHPLRLFIPRADFFPMCTMNLAFRREIVPLMYFPLMGKPWFYDRFDDIWAGIFLKKILDHLSLAVVSGSPFVEHRKASDPASNFRKEKRGMKTNEMLWKRVEQVKLTGKTPKGCYLELAQKIEFPEEKYFAKLKEAMTAWTNLFS